MRPIIWAVLSVVALATNGSVLTVRYFHANINESFVKNCSLHKMVPIEQVQIN